MPKNTLKPEVEQLLQDAVHSELFAAHLYRHLAAQMQRLGFFGASKFFREEASSELEHYEKHVGYLNDRGSCAQTPELVAISDTMISLNHAVTTAYNTELQLMQDYADWSEAADPVTRQFLLQFLEIQRTSVGEYGDLLTRLERAGADPAGILIIDKEMGS